jgi:hypothetical protein
MGKKNHRQNEAQIAGMLATLVTTVDEMVKTFIESVVLSLLLLCFAALSLPHQCSLAAHYTLYVQNSERERVGVCLFFFARLRLSSCVNLRPVNDGF